MKVKYIYGYGGKQESVVIPINLWKLIQLSLPESVLWKEPTRQKDTKAFEPKDYFGIISHLNLDIEEELQIMRNEWDRTF